MTVDFPEAAPSKGYSKVTAATAVATLTAPSLGTEVSAASSVEVSGYLFDFAPTATQNKGSQPARLATTSQLDQLGLTSYSIPTLTYVYDPQGDDTADANKAKALLAEGAEVYLIERLGLLAKSVPFTVGDRVRVHHVRMGTQVPTRSGDDEFAVRQISQEVAYLEEPVDGVLAA